MQNKKITGFTLVELLVVLAIIGILTALSLVSFQGARKSARDGKRKADIEQIRSALEVYRTDCQTYPSLLPVPPALLVGETGQPCAGNVYMSVIPADPGTFSYSYKRSAPNSYAICAHLELCTGCLSYEAVCGAGTCGSENCNYMQANP